MKNNGKKLERKKKNTVYFIELINIKIKTDCYFYQPYCRERLF